MTASVDPYALLYEIGTIRSYHNTIEQLSVIPVVGISIFELL